MKTKIIDWLNDKYCWLKTFNKLPEIEINADLIQGNGVQPVITIRGRVHLIANCKVVQPIKNDSADAYSMLIK